ncbi:MAG: hypothetical protein N3A01_01350, partial [Bacteroidales bacterium]|nr:hypothetical protein [Bacteroidales bacterium]
MKILLLILLVISKVFSQQKNWEIRYGSEKAFILNVGQFNNEVLGRYSTPEYAYDGSQEDY